ncbi:pyridoxamine 5'-phosphate oxidase family protein [uncultured Alsobacter sp.]|uniref:pyridoxamine 5'-phosphate oxidase family protein n=1 Tax=uncultured Alsobacter sp. TaxID=1748258 RepID=UPI0025F43D06|nr:pyridoxamine 5'-phosphate oxidase family protein [uncultured Alsobacter sp.]
MPTHEPHAAPSSDVAFTPTVKAIQREKGSRRAYARQEEAGGWPDRVTPDLAAFLANQTSAFLATVNAEGQPYIQHRGGPPGFIKVVDARTLGFADFSGNRQYVTLGNLRDNPKAHLFLIDYRTRQRIKIWGTAEAVEGDDDLVRRLMPEGYAARPERAILLRIAAFDVNCPKHIPQRFDAAEVAAALAERDETIRVLREDLERLRGR